MYCSKRDTCAPPPHPCHPPTHPTTPHSAAAVSTATTPALRGLVQPAPAFTTKTEDAVVAAPVVNLGQTELTWTGTEKELRVNGQTFHLKGVRYDT